MSQDPSTATTPEVENLQRDPSPDPGPSSSGAVSAPGLKNFLNVLGIPNFLTLWSGQVFSQLADKVCLVLLIGLVSSHFQAEGQSISGWVSAIMTAFTLPAILFGTIAGVYVDRWSKKVVLVGSNILRGGLLLLLPLILAYKGGGTLGGLPIGFDALLLITFGVSTLTQYFAPAEQSAIPLIVPKRDLLPANSLYTTTMMASVILGFAIGEPVLEFASWGLRWVSPDPELGRVLVVGGGYIVAGLILLRLRTGEEDHASSESEETHIWQDIRIGLQFLQKTPVVRAAMLQLVALFALFAALAVLAVRMAELLPSLETSEFGFLLAAAGGGMALGAFWIGQQGEHVNSQRLGCLGSVGIAIALALLGWNHSSLVLSLLLIAVIGGMGALVGVPMQTLIQTLTPVNLRGKVFGLQNNVTNIALSLPLLAAGVAETYFGLRAVLLGLAGLTLVVGALAWRMMAVVQTGDPGSR
jgi:MFS family permease